MIVGIIRMTRCALYYKDIIRGELYMKKIVVATDSFKGSLTTFESGKAIEEAAKEVYENTDVIISPIADGGEGTVEAIISAANAN